MMESEKIKKAIRHFNCMRNDAIVVLDSGFGTNPSESNLVYRSRKMYAELAILALEKQMPKKPYYEAGGYAGGELVYDAAKCPTCEHDFEYGINDWGCEYCCNCGQKLDWSVEEWAD